MNRVEALARRDAVQAVLAACDERRDEIIEAAVAIQQVPAPTFAEVERAVAIAEQFVEVGLEDVGRDGLENVFGRFPGRDGGERPPVVVSAHTDTVFPAGTDLTVRRDGTRVYGPGIADNSLGVAGLLFLAQTLRRFDLRPGRDVWFVANVGEEGLGDLRGMRAVVDRFGRAAAYVVVEGGMYGRICHQAIGVRRYRIDVAAPGGHSWASFGQPSAVHVLGRLIAAIDDLDVPAQPKTTYNVGVVAGGTTVNTIAAAAHLVLDLRSEDPAALARLVQQVQAIVYGARVGEDVAVTMEEIGNRPAGQIPPDHALVSHAEAALDQVGCEQVEFTTGSTDANIPLSRGFPAVCIGLTRSGNTHRVDEYMDVTPLPAGVGQLLLLVLAAADT